jgi:hypothetical protein
MTGALSRVYGQAITGPLLVQAADGYERERLLLAWT